MEIGSIIQGNSTVNDALNGLTVGSLFDGTFLRGLAGNLIGMLSKWFNDKLKYVIGFDLSSWDGTLIDLFRKLWDKYASKFLGKWSSLLGGLLFGWLNPTDDSLGLRKVSPDGDLVLEPTGPQFLASYDTTFDSEDGRRYLVATEGDYLGTLGGIEGYYIEGVNPSGPRDKELDLAPFDQKMLEYFSFYLTDEELPPAKKVVDYKLQTEPFAGYESKGEIVLKPEKSKREKSFYESMHDLEYKDFQDALGLVKEEFSIGIERADTITKFNRWRIPTVDNELTSSRGHVFFTRPDLNLAVQIYDNQENVKQSYSSYTPLIFNLLKQHSTLMKYLTGSAVDSHYFIPVLSDRCTGIDVSDEIIDTHEHGQTKTGWKFMYGGSMTKSKTAGTVNVTFTDDDMLSVYKILKVWTEYINAVYKGEMSPKLQYLKNHILDYAISIYYVLTKADGEDVIFFTKYTGCFPTSVPSSNFSDVLGTPIKRPNYTIPFTYARKDDYNPLHIAEFNHLSSADYKYAPVYNNKTARSARSFVGAPFIDTLNGSYSFKLRYRDDSSENGMSALLKTSATKYVKSLF